MPSRVVLIGVASAAILFVALAVRAQAPPIPGILSPLPAFTEAPVFFELFANAYADSANLRLLPEGKVRLIPLGVEDVGDFDWRNHARGDLSWWMRIEDLQYLLPAINSPEGEDKRFAREWVEGWLEVHDRDPRPNPGAWQPMTAGIRALVLVRFLKELHDSGERDTGFEKRLRESIIEHQRFLEQRDNFEGRSNHGMWEALGLFETARVTGGVEAAAFALERLANVVNMSVSGLGVHKEHAASYHFYFSRWLSDFVRYFETLGVDVGALRGVAARMREAAYYLVDHGGNVPQIGDTDAMRVDPDSLGTPLRARDGVLFDESGGIAVFKDPPGREFARYIAFNIRQLRNLTLSLAHTHRDILAVYFSCDGEVILGDGGRYGYTDSVPRRYFVSSPAHNTIVPIESLDSSMHVRGPIGGVAPALERDARSVVFVGNYIRHLAVRRVTIPRGEPGFAVEDSIGPDLEAVVLWNAGRDVVDVSEERRVESGEELTYSWILTSKKGRRYELELTLPAMDRRDARVKVVRGQESPMLGWYSPGYHQMVPVTVFQVVVESSDVVYIRTRVTRI